MGNRPTAAEIFTHIVINGDELGVAKKHAVVKSLMERIGYSEQEVNDTLGLLRRMEFIVIDGDELKIRKEE